MLRYVLQYFYFVTDYLGITEPSEMGYIINVFDDVRVIALEKPNSDDYWICMKKPNEITIILNNKTYNKTWREAIHLSNQLKNSGWTGMYRERIIELTDLKEYY